MEEQLFQMVKSFVIENGREPKLIVMNYDNFKAYTEIQWQNYHCYGLKFMMCKVISSHEAKTIEIY